MKSTFKKSLCCHLLVLLTGFMLVPTSESYAGELVPRQRRINFGGNGAATSRAMRVSTFAVRRLNGTRSTDRVTSLGQSNPYEARIVANQKAQRQYQIQLARYNNRLETMELRAQVKAKKERERKNEKQTRLYEREKDKARREAQRMAREKQRAATSSTRSIFGSSKPAADNSAVGATGATSEAQRRPTLWQRLKSWLFGTSSDSSKL